MDASVAPRTDRRRAGATDGCATADPPSAEAPPRGALDKKGAVPPHRRVHIHAPSPGRAPSGRSCPVNQRPALQSRQMRRRARCRGRRGGGTRPAQTPSCHRPTRRRPRRREESRQGGERPQRSRRRRRRAQRVGEVGGGERVLEHPTSEVAEAGGPAGAPLPPTVAYPNGRHTSLPVRLAGRSSLGLVSRLATRSEA